jgi:hypothetical protein
MSEERYKNGKIYTIRYRGDAALIYVGSTCLPLYKRWYHHKKNCFNENCQGNNMLLYQTIRETNNINDWYVELYEEYPCDNKEQLLKREGEVIRELGNLNQRIAGRSDKEYYNDNKEKLMEKKKEYNFRNKERLAEYKKQYRVDNIEKSKQYIIDNKEKIAEQQKKWFERNKEQLSEKSKEKYIMERERYLEKNKIYYDQNKEKILEKKKENITCVCGCVVTKAKLKRHQQTKKHLDLINLNSNENNETL